MSWPEQSLVNQRREFVLQALSKGANISDLCRQHEISRKTGYKWIRRFGEFGVEGLVDQSRRPHQAPLKASAEFALEIVALRQETPRLGPKKLQAVLLRRHRRGVPSLRTIARVLKRVGLQGTRKRPLRDNTRGVSAPVVASDNPNDLWTVDFKGWWRAGNGEKCEPLTVRDAASRFVLTVELLPRHTSALVRQSFTALFERFGLPKAILSDNGSPFGCTRALGGLTQLSVWWISLGIQVIHSRPACPQDNGGHERMHADIAADLQVTPSTTRAKQQTLCTRWRENFNYERPHEALGQKTPADVYRKSDRRMSSVRLQRYPGRFEVRRVQRHGAFTYATVPIFVSRALREQSVGIERENGRARVWFRDLLLGDFDPEQPTRVEPISVATCNPVSSTVDASGLAPQASNTHPQKTPSFSVSSPRPPPRAAMQCRKSSRPNS